MRKAELETVISVVELQDLQTRLDESRKIRDEQEQRIEALFANSSRLSQLLAEANEELEWYRAMHPDQYSS